MSQDISRGRPCEGMSQSVMSLAILHTNILMKVMSKNVNDKIYTADNENITWVTYRIEGRWRGVAVLTP